MALALFFSLMLGQSVLAQIITVPSSPRPHGGYVSTRWYNSIPWATTTTLGSAPATTSTYFSPIFLTGNAVPTDVGFWVQQLGGNTKVAIYANDPTTMRPTGANLCTTGSIDVTGVGLKTGTITSCPVMEGFYWTATQVDNNAVRFTNAAGSQTYYAWLLGSTTAANVISLNGAGYAINVAGTTYGTMPTLSPGTFVEETSYRGPMIIFKVQ